MRCYYPFNGYHSSILGNESLIKEPCQKLTQQDTHNTTLNKCLVCYYSTLQESSVQDAGAYPVYGATGVCGYIDAPEVAGDSILIIKDCASVGIYSFPPR